MEKVLVIDDDSLVRGAIGEADMSLPVKSGPSKAQQAGRERVLRASRQRGVRSVDSGRMGCGIDSRNRLIAAAELAPAPAKAAHPLSVRERADAPPGAKARSRPNGSCRNLRDPSAATGTVGGGGGERGTTIGRRIADGSRTAP